jgi:hypothetical protein
MPTRFDDAYAEIVAGLASKDYSSDKDWQALIKRARKLVGATGLDDGEAGMTDDLRKKLAKAVASGGSEAVALFAGAGEQLSGNGPGVLIDGALAKRLGALKTLRHAYLLKRFGGHRVWCLSLPLSFTDWPHEALKGGLGPATVKLDDTSERFGLEDRKHLSHASQEALKWVHKAMVVSGDMKRPAHFACVARWFADAKSKDNDVVAMGATLNAGLKKIAARLKAGNLVLTDSVSERGTTANTGTEAFVWGDTIDVVYIEEEFFGTRNTLKGLTNWARIVVHELTHRECATTDHAYEHQGMNPKKISAARALENADSWAWFCAECAGALTPGVIQNALDR